MSDENLKDIASK